MDKEPPTLEVELFYLKIKNANLKRVIQKAVDDIDLAECGEGYQLNLPDIINDLKKSLVD